MRFDKKIQAIKTVRVGFERDNNIRLGLRDTHEFIKALEESTDQRIMSFIESVNGAPPKTNEERIQEAFAVSEKWTKNTGMGVEEFIREMRKAVE